MLEFDFRVETDRACLLADVWLSDSWRSYRGTYAWLYDGRDREYEHPIGELCYPDARFAVSPEAPSLWEGVPNRRTITWYLLDASGDGIELTRLVPFVRDGEIGGLTYDEDNVLFHASGLRVHPSAGELREEAHGQACCPKVAGQAVFDASGRKLYNIRYDKAVSRPGMSSLSARAVGSEFECRTFFFTLSGSEFLPCDTVVDSVTLVAVVSLGPYGYSVKAPDIEFRIKVLAATQQ